MITEHNSAMFRKGYGMVNIIDLLQLQVDLHAAG
ncbi:hypothetical protein NIES2109_17280 [Nostoc sp. HK-01]|uniref:Uncharacterized protein n=1 Tax=Anabaenopsis circularis NIES-21 TaxID=1085406 RepID=A0A1Z4GHH4_9CYAN|nr:hypothetical protein NIES21_27810 [Anabaenopsis circularis NIES-21]BBD58949.1 hypothetical protein NIES2109_17280 [Nostoc sp. HK-01]